MITLVFLVCSTVSGECYSATSTTIHFQEEACISEAVAILERNYALQKEGKWPPEKAIFKCIEWGEPA